MLSPGCEARPDQQVTLPGLERGVESWGAVESRRPRRESVDSPALPVQHPLPLIRRETLVRRREVPARHRGWFPVRVLGWLPTGCYDFNFPMLTITRQTLLFFKRTLDVTMTSL